MKRRMGAWKRCCAVLLALVLMLGNLSGVTVPVLAKTTVFGGMGTKTADLATVNGWKEVVEPLNTSFAGGVWTDKSVFDSADAYFAATDEEENQAAVDAILLENSRDFLISLSAIASTKTIVGYSTLPTDTVFVLDVSGSMDSGSRDSRMVEAANKAIGDLLALNNYNRVGVVLYSSDATMLMPLDRYTTTSTTTMDNETIPSYIYLNSRDNVTVSSGVRNSSNNRPDGSREVTGGTYIQSGIYMAMGELTDPNLDTVITEGFQIGTTRTPIMVLMSDGAPTYGVNTYTTVGSRNMGNGSTTTSDLSFMTQLTAAWAKAKIGEKYGDEVEPLIYTLGLGVGDDSLALSVMDPTNRYANAGVDAYWDTFNTIEEGETVTLQNSTYTDYVWVEGNRPGRGEWQSITRNRTVTKLNDGVDDNNDTLPIAQDYVNKYFAAGTANELSAAFQSIVDTIVLQTMYYPTLVEDDDVFHGGHMEFRDYIGPNMEVKEVEGIQLGETLYTGERFAELVATGMGTPENPTDAGNELVWSILTRLKIGQAGDDEAEAVVHDLLEKAWAAGQLAYNEDYDGNVTWSNWFGWYADENEEYLGFWDGDGIDPEMVGKAAYAIKSYLVLGGVGEGHRETDMFYASVQVRSALDQNGDVIEDIVYGRLPASLIPLVEYNVELNSNDPATATEITLTTAGATAPSRLIYEVGLRDKIDLLDMEGTAVEDLNTDADGNFIFYTNQWDNDGLAEGVHPSSFHNTYVNFYPSVENERYYYHEDMPIYVRSGSGYVRYSGAKPVAGDGNTYYRANVIYSAGTNGGAATYSVEYQPIPDIALADEAVMPISGTNNWVVKRGTCYRLVVREPAEKVENLTGTLPYAEYGIIHDDPAAGYHLDVILGNNGLLVIDPLEGLKVTKRADETILDVGQTYTFHVELTQGSHDGAEIYLFIGQDGVRSVGEKIEFTDGSYELELGINDSAWLVGLPEGNLYTVTEEIDGEYEVSAITVDGDESDEAAALIEKNHIVKVEFTNSAVYTGDITVSKNVISSYEPHLTEDYGFVFDVTVTGAEPGTMYETVNVLTDGGVGSSNGILVTNELGEAQVQVTLSHGEGFTILDLPEGATVTALETQLPGFTSNYTDNTASADVVVGENTAIAFINTYEPEPVSPHGTVDVYVQKILEGRDWDADDAFTFVLEKHVSKDEHIVFEEITVDYSDDDKIADFQSNINELYDAVGTYSYRIVEEAGDLPGVAYDTAICYFDIVVEDDGEGSLYIADVIGRQDVEVKHEQTANKWSVTGDFINTYNAEGAIQVSLSVEKQIEDDAQTGITKAGYTFELYDADEDFVPAQTPRASVQTNAEGVAAFRDTLFTEEGTYYFVLKEAEGDIARMEYDPTVYHCTVEITSDPETSGLVAAGTVINTADGETVYEGDAVYEPVEGTQTAVIPVMAYTAEFTNVYEPLEVETPIVGTKDITGRRINDGEFTFELYEAELTDEGFVVGDYIDEVTNDGYDFSFEGIDALTYYKTGEYYYAIKEAKGDLGGVTYDETVFYVTVRVTADVENGTLVVSAVNVTDAAGANKPLAFRNTYRPAATEAEIAGTKELTGTRRLAADMFQFYLHETGSDFAVSGDPLQTVTNDANGGVSFDLSYNQVGEHYYVVSERIPAGLGADERRNGVDYDETTYRVQVSVTDDQRGSLVADVTYLDGTPAFVNDYTPQATAPVVISGDKVLSGRDQTAGEFTFAMYAADSKFVPVSTSPVATASNVQTASGGFSFTFDGLTFDQAGGYRFLVKELPGDDGQIRYDGGTYYVIVTVSDNGRGQLIANTAVGNAIDANGVITAPVSRMEFYNVFTHMPAGLALSGNKYLDGHEWSHEETEHTFVFELYEANNEFVITEGLQPITAVNDPAKTGEEGEFTFSELIFEQEGTYYYVIKERLPAGVTAENPRDEATGIIYDTGARHITVTVAEDPDDPKALKATYLVDGAEGEIAFTNRYVAEGEVFATVSGKKVMEGRNLHTDGFSFVLKDSAGNVVETVINNGDGTTNEGAFSFRPLTYNAAGIYTYTVEELDGTVPGVTYSEDVYTVTVTVGDKDGKLLEPVVTYRKGNAAADGIVFTNVYKAEASEPLVLEGTKTLAGGVLEDGVFRFELFEATVDAEGKFTAGTKLNEVSNAGGKFAFEGQIYEETGTYYYVITERVGNSAGVTYDDNEFYITVVVEDPGDGQLTARVDSIAGKTHTVGVGVNFTNVYTPEPTTVVFDGEKNLNGRDMIDGEFTFELYQTDVNHTVAENAQPMDTAVNEGRVFAFDEIALDKVGSYYYVVKEKKGTAANVTYDTTVYRITVDVTNNGGVLETEVTYKVGSEVKDGIVFVNSYRKPDPQPDPIEIELEVEKILKGSGYRYGLEGFVFDLMDEDGDVIDTAESDDRGEATLTVGTFRKSDAGKTFTYYVCEVDTEIRGMTYSTREYEVEITVFYDSSRNKLTYELVKDGDEVDGDEPFVFTNIYNPGGSYDPHDPYFPEDPADPYVPMSPATGDEGAGMWIALLIFGTLGFALTVLVMVKRRRV